ncbi:MAG: hypothetical protein P8L32_08810 [Paracoccaceae bacterium]|jgi:hypothetical protein|nr:hypothetical protein [Paracoccaceae bacterium]
MKQKNTSDNSTSPAKSRDDRLKAALKANMARRKAQAKARGTGKPAATQNKG